MIQLTGMVDPNLINYIKDSRLQGASDDVIRQVLITAGWQEQQINDAFAFLNLQNAPLPPMPAPVYPSASSLQPQTPEQSPKPNTPLKPRVVSPYSSLLAVVLFISLMILMNNLIYDLIDYFDPSINYNSNSYYDGFNSGDATIKLTVSAFIVVPFWFITFLLYYFYREKGEKLRVLLTPYYITSGWLLIWLLFQVSLLLLNSNAAFGVYLVLILMGAVLTGVVWGIQRYRNVSKTTINQ
ncbi:MAG: hypothetical protein HYT62_02195 [Candidatus Yanofskybacteria bacterium]|nr:hypothetical protein [Candidatus Yanofskybacteria bacterium]